MKSFGIFFILFIITTLSTAQTKFTLSGYIRDAQNGEELIGASVYLTELQTGGITNVYGFYSITAPASVYVVKYSFLGYETFIDTINLTLNQRLDVKLKTAEHQIADVIVTAQGNDHNITSVEMSTNQLQMKTIQRLPALMGEVDVIKIIQMLPGVKSSGEGSIGYYVRGGGVDQNLILLDEATVYNPSHLGGIFSVFNQDAIKDVKLYKGGIPAQYGGRLSSLLDVRMKDGNSQKFSGTGGIGLISSRLTVEGPIVKDKSSFIISGRRTYADIFFPISKDSAVRESKAYFYDFNLKANYRINNDNRIFLSAYFGKDIASFGDAASFSYGNATTTFRWNHLFNEKLFSNVTLLYSKFDYSFGMPDEISGFDWISHITDFSFSNDYTWYLNTQNTINFGASVVHHKFEPGRMENLGENTIFNDISLPENFALEYNMFAGNEQKLGSRFTLQYGLRFSAFQNVGSATWYQFDKTNPAQYSVIDTVTQQKGDVYNTYWGVEPRFSVNFQYDATTAFKASYNHMIQYMHLATNTMSPTPLDVWYPSSPNIQPQQADQVALGYFKNFMGNALETSIEVYYKEMHNIIDFRDHASMLGNRFFEGEVRKGDGTAYGLEVLLRKNEGDLTGWISYTWSRSTCIFPEINNGKEYPTPYDKIHDISIVFSYQLTERINFGGNWVFSTGAPRTMPVGRFQYGNMLIPIYSDRNSVRLPNYHRLDLGFTIDGRKAADKPAKRNGKPRKNYESSLSVSVYNVYNRHNAYSVTFSQSDENPNITEAEKVYLFKIFPSITYNFKF